MFQPCLFNIQNNPFHQFPRIWGLEKIQSSTGNVCVSHSVCETFSQIFHVFWSTQVELWSRSRWVRWFWAVSVTCRHDPPFVPWWLTRSWGVCKPGQIWPGTPSQWTDELKWWERTSPCFCPDCWHTDRPKIQAFGELWQSLSRLSPCSCLCPLSASFTPGLNGFRAS